MAFENKTRLRKAKEARVSEKLKGREFRMIPIGKIVVSPNLGIDSDSNLEEMTEEILEHGLLSPVSVVGPYEDGNYQVIEGARRIKSLRTFLKGDAIPCYLVEGPVPDKEMQMLALAANRVHRDNDSSLNVKYAQIIFDECVEGWVEERHAAAALSEISGLTKKQARKYMRVTKDGTAKMQEAVAGGNLPIDLATEVIKAAPDDEKQQDLMTEVLSNRPYGTLTAFRRSVKAGEFSSHDRRALEAHADYIAAVHEKKKHSDELENQIKRAEDSLSYLLSLEQELPPSSVYRLTGLCGKFVSTYGTSAAESVGA